MPSLSFKEADQEIPGQNAEGKEGRQGREEVFALIATSSEVKRVAPNALFLCARAAGWAGLAVFATGMEEALIIFSISSSILDRRSYPNNKHRVVEF